MMMKTAFIIIPNRNGLFGGRGGGVGFTKKGLILNICQKPFSCSYTTYIGELFVGDVI